MRTPQKIRVLIVDDSLLSRGAMARGLSADPNIEVVAVAADAFDARDKILALRPDVITCDVEMPKMNGIEFVRRLLPQYFVPIVMVSALSQAVFDAMEAGAVDFVAKPGGGAADFDAFLRDLIEKVKAAAGVKAPPRPQRTPARPPVRVEEDAVHADRIIAIAASTGGTEAIFRLLRWLPANMPGMVVVQHIPPVFSGMYAERLNRQTAFDVKEAQTGDVVESGRVLVAPGDRHMRVRRVGRRFEVECFVAERVSGHRPSADVLFDSVAQQAGDAAIGVLLTGMGSDGAKGLLSIRRSGGRTIGQDAASSVVYGMPKVGFDIGAVERQAGLDAIPGIVCELLGQMRRPRPDAGHTNVE